MKKNIRLLSLILAIILFGTNISYGEIKDKSLDTNLRAYLIGDYKTGRILEGNNIDNIIEIASISKVMSYMVVMDSGIDLNEKVLIDQDTLSIGGSIMKLEGGKEYTVDKLLDYSLVISSNNAIYALAKYVSGSEERFVEKMNDKAKEIGLETAKFYNSTGLPVKGQDVQNVMSSRDIFNMAVYVIKNYPILEKTSIESIRGLDFFGVEKNLKNTNPTMLMGEVDGLKTGHTNKAGYCLVATFPVSLNDRIVGIFMGAKTDEKRTEITRDATVYINERYKEKELLWKDEVVGSLTIENSNRKNLEVYPIDNYSGVVDNTKDISYELKAYERPNFPIKKGEALGVVKIKNGDTIIYESDVIAEKTVREMNIVSKFFQSIGDFFRTLSVL